MNLKVCNCCGRNLTNDSHYNMIINLADKKKYTSEVENIDLCPECYEKLIKDTKTFKYGEDKIAEAPSEGVMTQNFISRDEFLALQALFIKYSKNKRKLVKILDYFLFLIDSRISHEATEEVMNNIVAIATDWEQKAL